MEDVDKSRIDGSMVALTIFTLVCQSFFMGLFFFVSAYFMPGSYDRKGAGRFVGDRLLRLGIPLLVYYFVIHPVTVWFARFRGELTLGGFYAEYVWKFRGTYFGPAWFLEALIIFTVLYALYRRIFSSRGNAKKDRIAFPSGKTLLWTAIALGVTAFVVRLAYPTGTGPLELQLGYFPSYIVLFIAGCLAYRNGWLNEVSQRAVKRWTWIAVCSIPVLPLGLIATGALDGNITLYGGLNVQALLYAMWEPFVCIGIILFLLALFRRRFSGTGTWQRFLSANAYTVYLLHPPAIVGWTVAFHGVGLPPIVKWIIVSGLSVTTCFIAAAAVRSIPGVRRIL